MGKFEFDKDIQYDVLLPVHEKHFDIGKSKCVHFCNGACSNDPNDYTIVVHNCQFPQPKSSPIQANLLTGLGLGALHNKEFNATRWDFLSKLSQQYTEKVDLAALALLKILLHTDSWVTMGFQRDKGYYHDLESVGNDLIKFLEWKILEKKQGDEYLAWVKACNQQRGAAIPLLSDIIHHTRFLTLAEVLPYSNFEEYYTCVDHVMKTISLKDRLIEPVMESIIHPGSYWEGIKSFFIRITGQVLMCITNVNEQKEQVVLQNSQ